MSVVVLNVNGRQERVEAPSEEALLWVLRNRLQLTGTKYGCGEGMCGACTVLLDGLPVRSCRVRVSAAAEKNIITIEGLEQNGQLHPVQQAFLDHEAFQCGYCTPGMILAAVGLLRVNPDPSDAEIIRSLNGSVCRCGTYPRIIAAVKKAAAITRRG